MDPDPVKAMVVCTSGSVVIMVPLLQAGIRFSTAVTLPLIVVITFLTTGGTNGQGMSKVRFLAMISISETELVRQFRITLYKVPMFGVSLSEWHLCFTN